MPVLIFLTITKTETNILWLWRGKCLNRIWDSVSVLLMPWCDYPGCSPLNLAMTNAFFCHTLDEIKTYIKQFLLIFVCTTSLFYMEHPYRHTEANIQFVGQQQWFTCYRIAGELTQKENKPSFAPFIHQGTN